MNANALVVIIASLFTSGTNNLVDFCEFTMHNLVLFAHLLSLSNKISSSFTIQNVPISRLF